MSRHIPFGVEWHGPTRLIAAAPIGSCRNAFGTPLERFDVRLATFPREVPAQCPPSTASSPLLASVGRLVHAPAAGRLAANRGQIVSGESAQRCQSCAASA